MKTQGFNFQLYCNIDARKQHCTENWRTEISSYTQKKVKDAT